MLGRKKMNCTCKIEKYMWIRSDSNLHPTGYEHGALANYSIRLLMQVRHVNTQYKLRTVPRALLVLGGADMKNTR